MAANYDHIQHLRKVFQKFPNIELGDVKLREVMLHDAEKYLEMMTDPEVVKYSSDEDLPSTIENATEEVKYYGGLFYKKNGIYWAIADAKTDEFMGMIGISNWSFYNERAEISYYLLQQHWNKGLMSKILPNVIMFAYNTLKLHRIEARTMQGNESSQKILKKAGFKLEGLQKGYRLIRGVYEDITLYSAVRNEYTGFLADK